MSQQNALFIFAGFVGFAIFVLVYIFGLTKSRDTLSRLAAAALLVVYFIWFDVPQAYNLVEKSSALPQKVAKLKSENQKLRELNDQLISQVKKDREEAALLVSDVKEFAKEALAQTTQQLKHNAEIKKVLDEAYSVLQNCKKRN